MIVDTSRGLEMSKRPSVLFVCVKNGGKSQMAAALMRRLAGDAVAVSSAGTKPGSSLNRESEAAMVEVGVSMVGERPKAIDPAVLAGADRVVVLGSEAVVEPMPGMRGTIETWEIDEPSLRGIDGMDRMRLVRDDIDARVHALYADLTREDGAPENAATGPRDTPSGPRIRVYEPALCCNTGVCGPDVDEALVTFTADLAHLQGMGIDIDRHNLANDPGAFAAEPPVAAFLQVAGSAGLPLVLVDGVTVATGRYPDRAELLRLSGRADAGAIAASGPTGDAPQTHGPDLGLAPASGSGGCCSGTTTTPGCC